MAEIDTTNVTNTTPETDPQTVDTNEANTTATETAELAKLRAELARQKQALDKATSEAASMKKQLRAKQSEEEIAAEEKRLADEARDKELAELRKRFAQAENSKKLMGFIGDEATANTVAEYLYGAEDVDAAITALNKAWQAREKALKAEFGKIPGPGVGGSEGASITLEQLDAMGYRERAAFAREHPAEYNTLMGRS